MKNILLIILVFSITLACKKSNYAYFQESKFSQNESFHKKAITAFSIENNSIFKPISFKKNTNNFSSIENFKLNNNIPKPKNVKIRKYNNLNKTSINQNDTLKKPKINYNKIASISGISLFSSIIAYIIGISISIPVLVILSILLILTAFISGLISVKKAKKQLKIWPILSISIFSIILILLGIVIIALSNLEY